MSVRNWLCYYGAAIGPEIYSRFDLVVFDGTYHPPLIRQNGGKPLLLGYVSIGEVEEDGHLWPHAQGRPYLVRKNPRWNSWIVDVRDRRWRDLLYETVVPSVLGEGFDGLFVDTIDSSLELSRGDERGEFAGTREVLREIISGIKGRSPGKLLAVNRGLPLLPDIARDVDFVTVEGLYSQYMGPEKGYGRVDDRTRELLLEQIGDALRVKPGLTVLTLDYAEAEKADLALKAASFSKMKGFVPYVSNYRLDQVYHAFMD